jgi:60 kDa SS-A/Ro ribonucleoprotein
MASLELFARWREKKLLPPADAVNEARGRAYGLTPEAALVQYAMTGCLNTTFYASDETQLSNVLGLVDKLPAEFIARVAILARERGHMKDMPALLTAVLAATDTEIFERVFPRTIDNGKMLRNFVQMIRSGALPRRSFGTVVKRSIQEWLEARPDRALIHDSVGARPSLADIIKMVHPKPANRERAALYGYLIGKAGVDLTLLPEAIREFEAFKKTPGDQLPDVPFAWLTSQTLTPAHWAVIAKRAPWQMARMNLNSFARHDVFKKTDNVKVVRERLEDADQVRKSRVFPYQLMMARQNLTEGVPAEIGRALDNALEIALENVPSFTGQVYLCTDVSGSMQSPVTGYRAVISKVRCVDVAALFAAAILRKNPGARVLPFAERVVSVKLKAEDSVMKNAGRLAAIYGGGTNCSAPLAWLNAHRAMGELVVYISDNESWMDSSGSSPQATKTQREWVKFKERNPRARLVNIDIQPNRTVQAKTSPDVLNVGGFSDQVFNVVHQFASGEADGEHWLKEMSQIVI